MTEHQQNTEPLLEIEGLRIRYGDGAAVDGVSLSIGAGEAVAIVGESGSGKSTTALAALGLLPPTAVVEAGRVTWRGGEGAAAGAGASGAGLDILSASERQLRRVRGAGIGYIPQDPTLSLDPTQTVGGQVAEALEVHGVAAGREAARRAVALLDTAGLSEPERRAKQYPHQLSGGMRQRVLIAIAWACSPRLIIADEPTSALDVTVQRRVLDRLDELRRENGTALLLVTHDLAVASDRADRIVVMSQGRIEEQGATADVLARPTAAYTRRLLAAVPAWHERVVTDARVAVGAEPAEAPGASGASASVTAARPLISARSLVKEYASTRPDGSRFRFRAVDDVSFTIDRGRTLAIVGESGSGKSTTARLVMNLERPTSGSVLLDDVETSGLRGGALRRVRRRFQIIQQNPFSALSPQWTVERIVGEPLRSFRVGTAATRRTRVLELLDRVGLPGSYAERRPHQLSGGQRQRVAIARALALGPDLVVCDEPVSALDVSVQAQVLELLAELQRDLDLAYLFISHDLSVVREVAHSVAVIRAGTVVESGTAEQVLERPHHEYTRALLDAVPGRRGAAGTAVAREGAIS